MWASQQSWGEGTGRKVELSPLNWCGDWLSEGYWLVVRGPGWTMVSLLSLVAPSCPAAPAGSWQHPLVLWGPEEGWVVLLHVWGVGWMSTMACDQEPFLPGLPQVGIQSWILAMSLSSQIEPKETVINPSISMCWLAATLYIPPVLCEGPFLLSRLLIGQHSFQCFVNLRDNTSTDLICIIWPLSFFVGFFFFVGMAVNYLIFFSELFMSFVQLSWGAHLLLPHGFVNIPFILVIVTVVWFWLSLAMTYSMLFAFIFMFTKDFTTILVCLLWLNKNRSSWETPERGAGVGTAGTLRVGIGGIRTRDTKDSKALISRPRSISNRGCRKKIPALLLMRTLRFYRKTEHT